MDMKFCDLCKQFLFDVVKQNIAEDGRWRWIEDPFKNHGRWVLVFYHQPSVEAIRVSHKHGCKLCGMIEYALECYLESQNSDFIKPFPADDENSDIVLEHTVSSSRFYPCMTHSDEGVPRRRRLAEEFEICRTRPQVEFPSASYACVLDRVASSAHLRPLKWRLTCVDNIDEGFRLIRFWMDTCISTHPACHRKAKPFLPTRVIDVGPSDGLIEPFLHITNGDQGDYITFSHCWGGAQPLTLTTKTESERKRCIAVSSLPQNFRDAILMTRALHVRYLWIDSLCILQDSTEDWYSESSKMGSVYANSILTLGSSDSKNCHEGFLDGFCSKSSSPRFGYNIPLETLSNDMSFNDLNIRFGYDDVFNNVMGAIEGLSPLLKRAWVIQERVLSWRFLHISPRVNQLVWQCQSVIEAEDGYKGKYVDIAFQSPTDGPIEDIEMQADSKVYFDEYYKLVEIYSGKLLTKETDRLAALAGVAAHFRKKTGSKYWYGLWENDMRKGLSWRVPSSGVGSGINLQLSLAPSWSWASVIGKIAYYDDPCRWGPPDLDFWFSSDEEEDTESLPRPEDTASLPRPVDYLPGLLVLGLDNDGLQAVVMGGSPVGRLKVCGILDKCFMSVNDYRHGYIYDRELDGIAYGECQLDRDWTSQESSSRLHINGRPEKVLWQCFCLRLTGQDDQETCVAIVLEQALDNCFRRVGYAELRRPFPRKASATYLDWPITDGASLDQEQIDRRSYDAAPCVWETINLI